ncbi:hypothetical protein [Blochmannia endosymbiont of Camponotus sp.]|nr:hypothetical protein [Blochmannia endosymbiont of Camponotus sp.]URJ23970.1 hypothetical protein M9403_00375 [Blochmannia endosymbiont of Camponotus sp.]URJ25836.1 hypothetical protein M9401_00575 [Blochmannia endosymbiont of Camponotus sp.]URJ32261.1 hypothetical protein M9407_02505 [Blochmannia endosymbiont of Camponotus sp.]
MSYHSKQRLSIGMKLFLASGLVRMLIVLGILLCSWAAIFWSSLLP